MRWCTSETRSLVFIKSKHPTDLSRQDACGEVGEAGLSASRRSEGLVAGLLGLGYDGLEEPPGSEVGDSASGRRSAGLLPLTGADGVGDPSSELGNLGPVGVLLAQLVEVGDECDVEGPVGRDRLRIESPGDRFRCVVRVPPQGVELDGGTVSESLQELDELLELLRSGLQTVDFAMVPLGAVQQLVDVVRVIVELPSEAGAVDLDHVDVQGAASTGAVLVAERLDVLLVGLTNDDIDGTHGGLQSKC